MTIIATTPVPVSIRLDSAVTLTAVLPAPACQAWCTEEHSTLRGGDLHQNTPIEITGRTCTPAPTSTVGR